MATIDTTWQPAPVCVAATALLVHLRQTGNDLLKNDWCRCEEALSDGYRAGLAVLDGRVLVRNGLDIARNCLAAGHRGDLLLSAARKC